MYEYRLLQKNDLHLVEYVYKQNRKRPDHTFFTDSEIKNLLDQYEYLYDNDSLKISGAFEDNLILGIFTGKLSYKLYGWFLHGARVVRTQKHYNITAKIFAPALDMLLEETEKKLMFKMWTVDVNHSVALRRQIMLKYSSKLKNYDWYTELYLPDHIDMIGCELYDSIVKTVRGEKIIRLYILQEPFRQELTQKNYDRITHG
jgi:hypothetical protein